MALFLRRRVRSSSGWRPFGMFFANLRAHVPAELRTQLRASANDFAHHRCHDTLEFIFERVRVSIGVFDWFRGKLRLRHFIEFSGSEMLFRRPGLQSQHKIVKSGVRAFLSAGSTHLRRQDQFLRNCFFIFSTPSAMKAWSSLSFIRCFMPMASTRLYSGVMGFGVNR